jgi:DNA-directed RNA polymerase subunit RPC12/RpoP
MSIKNALYKCRRCGTEFHTRVPDNIVARESISLIQQQMGIGWHTCERASTHTVTGMGDLVGVKTLFPD